MRRHLFRAALLILLPLVGCLLGARYAAHISSDSTIPWESLGSPPEVPDEFLTTSPHIVVGSPSGAAYAYEDCNPECWSQVVPPPLAQTPVMEPLCGATAPPPLADQILFWEECTRWGLGFQYRAFAVTKDGSVFYWLTQFGGEFDYGLLLFPLGGALLLLVPAALLVALLYFLDFLARLRARARSSAGGCASTPDDRAPA